MIIISFRRFSVEYLGYVKGSFGYGPSKSKVDAIWVFARQMTLGPLHDVSGT